MVNKLRATTMVTLAGAVLLAMACGGDSGDAMPVTSGPSGLEDRASSEPIPTTFGMGRAATEADIARIDIDIMPDGEGLPPGSGVATDGQRIYEASCTACHGGELEGMPALGGRLVSPEHQTDFPDGDVPIDTRAIGNYWPYATTVFDYVRRAMPFDRPGSMTDDDVYAVTAYLLWKNGLIAEDQVVDATSLPAVEMPAEDNFVVDDRLEYDRVR